MDLFNWIKLSLVNTLRYFYNMLCMFTLCSFFFLSLGASKNKFRETIATNSITIGGREERRNQSAAATNRGVATTYRKFV